MPMKSFNSFHSPLNIYIINIYGCKVLLSNSFCFTPSCLTTFIASHLVPYQQFLPKASLLSNSFCFTPSCLTTFIASHLVPYQQFLPKASLLSNSFCFTPSCLTTFIASHLVPYQQFLPKASLLSNSFCFTPSCLTTFIASHLVPQQQLFTIVFHCKHHQNHQKAHQEVLCCRCYPQNSLSCSVPSLKPPSASYLEEACNLT